ncbi:MAG: mannose-1-phosphate guanylyltransferase [Deltaproteobacteria bacterium]|nr:mannose-1-phosphate guanylyltransferase [Deltaproteobacteria bacterium]
MKSSLISSLYLVIMAGGSGTRLWPLSRQKNPKQFLKVGADRSLVQETADRLIPPFHSDHLYIVCGNSHAQGMKEHFPNLNPTHFLLEPCGRNTAAAIALAAQVLQRKNPEAILVVLPADHKIPSEDLEAFQSLILEAAQFAQTKRGLMTLGIRPTFPATGSGYIQQGLKVAEGAPPIYQVSQFREKPDESTAQQYLESGNFLWNSGMFVWRAQDYLKAYAQFLPNDFNLIQQVEGEPGSTAFHQSIEKIYPQLTSISVDYAILEKSKEVYTLPAFFQWDDVGSLASLAKYFPKTGSENHHFGQASFYQSQNNFTHTDQGTIACIGVDDLIVIRQGDAVLVVPRERSEEVKGLLDLMKQEKKEKFL